MTRRPWHLSRRITLAFGVTTAVLAGTLSALAAWKVRQTLEQQADALAREELEETRAYLSRGPATHAYLEEIVRELTGLESHPMAWRLWNTRSGEPWGEFGRVDLFARVREPLGSSPEPRVPEDGLRWIAWELTPQLTVGILMDVSEVLARSRRFYLALLLFIVVSTCLATLGGHLVGRRVAGLLQQVARSARLAEAAPGEPLGGGEAPQEIRDVVEALQQTLQSIRKEAENARLVTSGLAHELRSPLQNLIGEVQVALLRQRDAGEYRRVLESQLEELRELSRVVDNLVTLCAAGELQRRRGKERFDLGQEARLRLAREFQLAARRNVRLAIETSGALDFEGDREAVLLALRNVLTNAIEWSPEGGSVRVQFQGDGPRVEILVDDQGPGVPPEQRLKIFEPFHRGSAACGRRAGFGLGLALTHSAVQAHGGRIEVGESPGGGARFRISLPRAGAAEPARGITVLQSVSGS